MRAVSDYNLLHIRGAGDVVVIHEPYPDDGGDPPIDPDDYDPEDDGGGEGDGGVQYTAKDIVVTASSTDVIVVAKAISAKIQSTDDVLPYDKSWINSEYVALILVEAGTYSVVSDVIRTYGAKTFSIAPGIDGLTEAQKIKGTIHNHPDELGNDSIDKLNRYPGQEDFDNLKAQKEANPDKYVDDPSIFVIDADGVMREFHLSQRDTFYNITQSQAEDGYMLPQPVL